MKKTSVIIVYLVLWSILIFVKATVTIDFIDTKVLSYMLTMFTLLFSFLVGYYLKSRYERYIFIRDAHIERHSQCLNLLDHVRCFSDSGELVKHAHERLNDIAIMCELTTWQEGHLEEPYYKRLFTLTPLINVNGPKDEQLFLNFLRTADDINNLTKRLVALGRDMLSPIHWFLLILLSLAISVLTMNVPVYHLLGITMLTIFPPSVLLAVYLVFSYQYMYHFREACFIEINQKIFDAIGRKRFYRKQQLRFVSPEIVKDKSLYRTEDELSGRDREVYLDYLDKEFYVDRESKKRAHPDHTMESASAPVTHAPSLVIEV